MKVDTNNFEPVFVHTVFFWLKNPDRAEDREAFVASLRKFLNASKYAHTNFIGTPPKATRDVVDGSFTFSLLVSFTSVENQNKYQAEDVHLTFVDEASHLWNKVVVYDSNEV
ncbi:Dabb family protein [Cellulophaga sp. 20_2_10]|uniref:Dabb family protein n=1 Tax=Cellulophaga sp. 20_2_10 TaxID=2942476 RepID=UPI00201B3019|nr:Dabb family protein [Cellulophaga sp. 20_2_10]MCL5245680.1 Dabb family protein [Cellulophaga sp. 20_2_10]